MSGELENMSWDMSKPNNKKVSCRQIKDHYYIAWLLELV